jgi:hypothetical protein
MQIKVQTNFPSVQAALRKAASQVPFAASVALNATAGRAQKDVQASMRQVFDRPTPWVVNSLRIKRATKANLVAELAFKDKNSVENSRSMVEPHIAGGDREYKGMEKRLAKIGLLPKGYNAVPGGGAKLDAYGNMSRGQISQMLNVLGTYTEAGYNKADARTRARLAKGNAKKNIYGFEYFVSFGKQGRLTMAIEGGERAVMVRGRATHLTPGIYQRVQTGFGTSLKPILIFVKRAKYRARLPFYAITEAAAAKHFEPEFNKAFEAAMKTALLKQQGQLI